MTSYSGSGECDDDCCWLIASAMRDFSGSAVGGRMEEGVCLMKCRFRFLRRSGSGGAIDVRLRGGLILSGFESWMAVIEVRNGYIVGEYRVCDWMSRFWGWDLPLCLKCEKIYEPASLTK